MWTRPSSTGFSLSSASESDNCSTWNTKAGLGAGRGPYPSRLFHVERAGGTHGDWPLRKTPPRCVISPAIPCVHRGGTLARTPQRGPPLMHTLRSFERGLQRQTWSPRWICPILWIATSFLRSRFVRSSRPYRTDVSSMSVRARVSLEYHWQSHSLPRGLHSLRVDAAAPIFCVTSYDPWR
jgi:hypothetical protein